MKRAWEHFGITRLRNDIRELDEANPVDWRWEELENFYRNTKNKSKSTVRQRVRHLRFMAGEGREPPPHPVMIHGTREDIVGSFLLFWRARKEETPEESWHSTLGNDLKAIRWLGSFLNIPEAVWPTKPPAPNTYGELPPPEDVRQLIQTHHVSKATRGKGAYMDRLVRHVLAVLFGLGLRPGEVWKMRVQDFNPGQHSLVVREIKKARGSRRPLSIKPRFLSSSPTRASLANWLIWREKVDPETDRMFPMPDGSDWASKAAFWKRIREHVLTDESFEWWTPKMGRTWSVNARLIEWDFDYAQVATWHGHEDINTTKNDYEQGAKFHRDLYGDNWLVRAFQKTPGNEREP